MNHGTFLYPTAVSVLALLCVSPPARGQTSDGRAYLTVRTAARAELTVDGYKTRQTGEIRYFWSPPLALNRNYSYTLRATWTQDGRQRQAERRVTVRAGQTTQVDLRTPQPVEEPPTASFGLLQPDPLTLDRGETKRIPIRISRSGFKGPVRVRVSKPSLSGETIIPAGKDSAQIDVTADIDAALGDQTAQLWGTAGDESEVRRLRVTVRKQPSLELRIEPAVRVRAGEQMPFIFRMHRERVAGSVTVKFKELPAGVSIPDVTIPADKDQGRFITTVDDRLEGTAKQVRAVATAGEVRAESTFQIVVMHQPPLAESYLLKGELAAGEAALLQQLNDLPKDDQARFGLGALQFIRAVERLGQSLYQYGVRSDRGRRLNVPFLRLPIPTNPKPELLTYGDFRKIFEDLIADLQKAESTLALIEDETVKLPLNVGRIRLDLDANGHPDDRFVTLLRQFVRGPASLAQDEELVIVFDRADVAWLRGYCHLLSAMSVVVLAHDSRELFECTAHVFFANPETPHRFLTTTANPPTMDPFMLGGDIRDFIAFVHLVRLPASEPDRLKEALHHLEQMLAMSKESWKLVIAETDDDHEWVPNADQRGVLGIRVRQEMIDSWLDFVDESQAILAGERLVPFWRGTENRGINLRRVFMEPRTFDLVLWVQGTAATPYLEKGPRTRPEVWNQLQRVFGGQFLGFAIWFN